MIHNPHKPSEPIMLSTPIGLDTLDNPFDPHAPFAACRLCGALYQHENDRTAFNYLERGILTEHFNHLTKDSYFTGPAYAVQLLDEGTARRARWRELHERRYHTDDEIASFAKTGFALTPEAAYKLAPYGITPLGKLHEEIDAALFDAPRAPNFDIEGS